MNDPPIHQALHLRRNSDTGVETERADALRMHTDRPLIAISVRPIDRTTTLPAFGINIVYNYIVVRFLHFAAAT